MKGPGSPLFAALPSTPFVLIGSLHALTNVPLGSLFALIIHTYSKSAGSGITIVHPSGSGSVFSTVGAFVALPFFWNLYSVYSLGIPFLPVILVGSLQ